MFGFGKKKESHDIPALSHDEYKEMQKKAFAKLTEYLQPDSPHKWHSLGETQGVKKWRLESKDSNVFTMRGQTVINVSAKTIVQAIADLDSRKQWDELFDSRTLKEMVHDGGEGNRLFVCHMKFKSPSAMVWPRDFAALTGSEFSEGKAMFFSQSVQHPDIPEDTAHYVRGQLNCSGYVVHEIEENKCLIDYIVQLDPKGWIPTVVVQSVSAQQPMTLKKLADYCEKLKN